MQIQMPRWLAPAIILAAVSGLCSGPSLAQVPPILTMNDAADFEGNAGTRNLVFTVTLSAAPSATVTALVSATPLTGTGFNPATAGASCSGSVDFVQQSNVLFTIVPPATTGTVPVTVCGNTTIEPNEHIFVALTSVAGAQCLEGTCNGVGTIRNDDGTPSLTINNISTSEPFFGTRTTSFTVSLSHPAPLAGSVNFTMRNGTARGAASCAPFTDGSLPDYVSRTGTQPFSVNALSVPIAITICGDTLTEGNQTYFVDLPSALSASIADNSGQGTIRDSQLITGGFDLSPDNARVLAGEKVPYSVVWTVPDGEVWRNLNTIDMRIRSGAITALWIRWEEPGNTFSLCEQAAHGIPGDDAEVVCGPGALPGSATVLQSRFAQLHLADTTVVGSGPSGLTVALNPVISFIGTPPLHYWIELTATDDLGHEDDFARAGAVGIEPVRAGH